MKWIRRYLGASIIIISCLVISVISNTFSWWLFVPLSWLPVALSFGYGGSNLVDKFIRRGVYGFSLGLVGLGVGVISGIYSLAIFQFVVAIMASLVLGIINPVKAVNEEALIGLLSILFIPFMV